MQQSKKAIGYIKKGVTSEDGHEIPGTFSINTNAIPIGHALAILLPDGKTVPIDVAGDGSAWSVKNSDDHVLLPRNQELPVITMLAQSEPQLH